LNIDIIRKSGAKRIVFSCPECYRTLKLDYPEYLGQDIFKGIELLHVSEIISQAMTEGKIKIDSSIIKEKLTYHDPCRLGHHLRVYDAPRKILTATGKFSEMEHSRELSVCCGTSTWLKCDANSKLMQINRLKEAKNVADRMLTACPKCLIHFKCAMSDKDGSIVKTEIEDMAVYINRITNGK
jgi:Fe-S oxidoreductase